MLFISAGLCHSRSGVQRSTLRAAFSSGLSLRGEYTVIYHSYTLLTHHYSSHTIFNEHKRLGRGCFSLTLSTEFILLSSQWLRGLPTSRQSFNIVFGECPYCSKVLMPYYFNSLVLGSLSLKQLFNPCVLSTRSKWALKFYFKRNTPPTNMKFVCT